MNINEVFKMLYKFVNPKITNPQCLSLQAEGSRISNMTPIHHQRFIRASPVHHQSIISASSVHHQRITRPDQTTLDQIRSDQTREDFHLADLILKLAF